MSNIIVLVALNKNVNKWQIDGVIKFMPSICVHKNGVKYGSKNN